VNAIHNIHRNEFVGYLYIMDLINAWKMEPVKRWYLTFVRVGVAH